MLFNSPLDQYETIPEIGLIPRYGSLTVSEHLALEAALDQDLLDRLSSPLAGLFFAPHISSVLCAVLLISRDRPTWTYGEIQLLQPATRQACADFLLGERRRWKPVSVIQQETAEKPTQPPEPIDWNAVFVRLASSPLWPALSRGREFADLPIAHIEQAIALLQQQELMGRYYDAQAIALNTLYLLAANGAKRLKVEDFNPWAVEIKRQEARRTMPVEACKLFMKLNKAGQVPVWAIEVADMEAIRLAAS